MIKPARNLEVQEADDQVKWAAMVGALMKSHQVMQELVDKACKGNWEVAVMLHQHLIDHTTPMLKHTLLEKHLAYNRTQCYLGRLIGMPVVCWRMRPDASADFCQRFL